MWIIDPHGNRPLQRSGGDQQKGMDEMKRTISSKKVLSELCRVFNENSEAYGYSMVTGDAETAEQLQTSMNTVCELLRTFDFHDGTDYVTFRDKKEVAGTPFMCYQKVVKDER